MLQLEALHPSVVTARVTCEPPAGVPDLYKGRENPDRRPCPDAQRRRVPVPVRLDTALSVDNAFMALGYIEMFARQRQQIGTLFFQQRSDSRGPVPDDARTVLYTGVEQERV